MAAHIVALVEDHENSQQVEFCLRGYGFDVTAVNRFVDAKVVLSSKNVDLIISDVHLENGGNVFDFLRWIKNGQATQRIPFALFSLKPSPMAKYLADGLRTAARTLGAVRYIEMDEFDADRFLLHINELLALDVDTN